MLAIHQRFNLKIAQGLEPRPATENDLPGHPPAPALRSPHDVHGTGPREASPLPVQGLPAYRAHLIQRAPHPSPRHILLDHPCLLRFLHFILGRGRCSEGVLGPPAPPQVRISILPRRLENLWGCPRGSV